MSIGRRRSRGLNIHYTLPPYVDAFLYRTTISLTAQTGLYLLSPHPHLSLSFSPHPHLSLYFSPHPHLSLSFSPHPHLSHQTPPSLSTDWLTMSLTSTLRLLSVLISTAQCSGALDAQLGDSESESEGEDRCDSSTVAGALCVAAWNWAVLCSWTLHFSSHH